MCRLHPYVFFHCIHIYCWLIKAQMWQFIPFRYFHMQVIMTDANVSSRGLGPLQHNHDTGVTLGGTAGSTSASEWPHTRMGCHSSLIDGIQDQKKKKQTLTQGQRGRVPACLCSAWNLVTKALTQTAAPTTLKMSKQFGDLEGLKSMLGWKDGAGAHTHTLTQTTFTQVPQASYAKKV